MRESRIITIQMQNQLPINPKLLQAISDPKQDLTLQYIRILAKQLKHSSEEATNFLKDTMISITNILKDPNIHPKIKYQSHRIIIYMILMADPDVYEHFSGTVYPVLRTNCMYNKNAAVQVRGEDFFRQSKYFTDPSTTAAQKAEIRKCGSLYIIFCLETVFMMAKWLQFDLEDDTKPTAYSIGYENLLKSGVEFPKEQKFKFYNEQKIDELQKVIRDIEKQIQSILGATSISELKMYSHQVNTDFKKVMKGSKGSRGSVAKRQNSLAIDQMYVESKSRIFELESQKDKLAIDKEKLTKQIDIQRDYYEKELEKERRVHRDNIFTYEQKIMKLQQQVQKMRLRITSLESRSSSEPPQIAESKVNTHNLSNDRIKEKLIQDLQNTNKQLNVTIKKMQEQIKTLASLKKKQNLNGQGNMNESASIASVQIEKLKKQNKSLKAKILTQCSQASEFSSKKSNAKTQNSEKQPQSLKFLGYEDSRSCFEPFYSNSPSQVKIRLRKAILRQKQLLYRDKYLEIGCIAKLQGLSSIRLITVFTNISQKPLFNFSIDYISREDIVVKMMQNTKNYLQISGQTKSQILVSVNQIDFRCLLCSARFNIEEQTQKIALIMPISKLKLAHQLVYTPIKKQQKLKKIQKLVACDRKILPNLHKFKDYFEQSILEVDRTMHETYYLKMQFMGIKLYIECDEVEGQLRIAVRYYEDEDFSRAEKLMDELAFLLGKS